VRLFSSFAFLSFKVTVFWYYYSSELTIPAIPTGVADI